MGWTNIGPETTSPHLSTRKKHDETVTSTNTATCNSCRSLIFSHEGFLKGHNRHSIKKKRTPTCLWKFETRHHGKIGFLKNPIPREKISERWGCFPTGIFFFKFHFFSFSRIYAYMKTRLFTEKSWGKQNLGFLWWCKRISNSQLLEFYAGFSRQPNGIKGVLS